MKSPHQFAMLDTNNKKSYLLLLLTKIQSPACVAMRNKIELFPDAAGSLFDQIYEGLYNSYHHHQNIKRLNKISQIQQSLRLYEDADANELDGQLTHIMAHI